MFSKKNFLAFFLSVLVSVIYTVSWILLSFIFHTPSACSAAAPIQPAILKCFSCFLLIFVPFAFVFLLMRAQINCLVKTQAELKTAGDTIEDRVQSRTADLKKCISDIKTVKGIITICANCKQIRNGHGRWEPVESYIERHTEAKFSHGLCRDCQKDLYGEKYTRFATAQEE